MKYLVIIAFAFMSSCASGDQKTGEEIKKEEPLAQSKNPDSFNEKFTNFLGHYFHLKDAFVLSNDAMAVTHAKLLSASADSLDMSEVKADASIVDMAKQYVQSVSSEAKGLAGEKDIEGKRKSFQMISDNVYDLVRTVRFDKQVLYHQFCPMAFNDAGAYWLSATSDIKNPYFGKKMLTCGEVKDSIDFRGK